AKPGECLEIGPGHGWLALWQLRSNAANTFLGLDISPHSVAYTRGVLGAAGIDRSRWKVLEQDAQKGIAAHAKPFDRVVIAEVIEHLAKPEIIVNATREHSHKDTLFFITTVVNLEAVDHIYLFRSLQEVRDFCTDKCGLTILDELDMPLKMNLKMEDEAYEVALVCKPRG
ncbi:MAG: class I SAM-dependent methyltransferase, partial [Phycisphaerae bacterium]|nr:class I SAM-dependent methyltransferase [Phycisphaerae bacterium]